MAYTIAGNELIAQNIADTSTTQKHGISHRIRAKDPTYGWGEFVYLLGVASTAVGDVVTFNAYTGATARWDGTANKGEPVAIAMSANVASQYGWYQISGAAVVSISGTIAARDSAFYAATGQVKTAAVAGKQLLGMVAASANAVPSAGLAVYTINHPYVQGQIT